MSGVVSRRASNLHRNITVTPFLNKLYSMVDDSASDDLIRWSADGNSFVVVRHEDFAKEVLPRFFKHSNFSSFVRQLNMYGFHKVPHLQQGGLITDGPEAESWEFSNDNFQRGQPDLLHFIRRKKGTRDNTSMARDAGDANMGEDALHPLPDSDGEESSHENTAPQLGLGDTLSNTTGRRPTDNPVSIAPATSSPAAAAAAATAAGRTASRGSGDSSARPRASRAAPVDMSKILKEIQVIRDHQLTISADIKRLQEENKSMWMQARSTEERYNKHQEMIDKILHFLATVFSTDARHSEIQPPLRRLISHDRHSGRDSDQPRPPKSTAWSQSVFEEMDFPDSLDADRPRDKRQRTGKPSQQQSSNIFEMPSGAPSPTGSTGSRTPQRAGSTSVDASSGRSVRRKVSNPQQLSTALTRTQPRPTFGSPRSQYSSAFSSNNGNSAAEGSGLIASQEVPNNDRLKTQSRSIEQLSQKVDDLGLSLENLTHQLNSGALFNMLAASVTPSVGLSPAPLPAGLFSNTANFANSGATVSPKAPHDVNTTLSSETLDSLAASLAGSGLPVSSQAFSAASTADSNAFNGASLASMFGSTASAPGTIMTTGPSEHTAVDNFYGDRTASSNAVDSNAIPDLSELYTPEQLEQLQQHLIHMLSSPNATRLLTDNSTNNDASLQTTGSTPFLDFVDPDPNGDSGSYEAQDAATHNEPIAASAPSDRSYTQLLLETLGNQTGHPEASSASDAFASDPSSIDNDLAASILQAVSSAPASSGDSLTTTDKQSTQDRQH
ncbi:Heat shock transcription factor [Coemansia guatemalensis]|uniref:Heat shock transcription factor n=1 Tax=Coemansia guatemalensis TaxID=2761395 RepID=A0A9W8LUN8_9FUNG|nr:Heat shock transcription factor [Coemansia guatemalensis]